MREDEGRSGYGQPGGTSTAQAAPLGTTASGMVGPTGGVYVTTAIQNPTARPGHLHRPRMRVPTAASAPIAAPTSPGFLGEVSLLHKKRVYCGFQDRRRPPGPRTCRVASRSGSMSGEGLAVPAPAPTQPDLASGGTRESRGPRSPPSGPLGDHASAALAGS